MGPWVLVILLVFGCAASAPELAPDEIDARDVRMPKNAQPGMFITWRITGDEIVEETIACVAPHTIEWRETFQDGRTVVTAARFRPDGTLTGVWRGPAGGAGEPLRAVERDFDMEAAQKEVDRHGISTDDAEVEQEHVRDTITTPAGTFDCLRWTMKGSLLIVKMRTDYWYTAKRTLPLSTIVKIRTTATMDDDYTKTLIAFGTSGAQPMLGLP